MLVTCFRGKGVLVPILQVGKKVTFLESRRRTLAEAEQGPHGGISSAAVPLIRKSRLS